MDEERRGAWMAASLARAARFTGVEPDGIHALGLAYALAMEPRVAVFEDDHHPLFLHPGRSALVLLRDVFCKDGPLLAAAALVESEDAPLRVPARDIRAALHAEIADLVEAVPMPGTESLAEALVTADRRVRLLALAERLDHLRHAHLREADERWRADAHAEACAIYWPVAERTHPRLAQRYEHWCRAFAKRLARG